MDTNFTTVTTITATNLLTTNAWTFIVGGFNPTNQTLFLGVALDGLGTFPGVKTNACLSVGNISLGFNFGADINSSVPDVSSNLLATGSVLDEWGFWNTALQQTQIQFLYSKTPFGSFNN